MLGRWLFFFKYNIDIKLIFIINAYNSNVIRFYKNGIPSGRRRTSLLRGMKNKLLYKRSKSWATRMAVR